MLTSSQRELLLRGEKEIDERLLNELRLTEKLIFEAFYRTWPDFAGRSVQWTSGANPPDILCNDNEGKRIGVELAEWLNEEQMNSSNIRERMEESFLEVIRSKKISYQQQSLDELYLLIYYDQGWFYNTPFNGPGLSFHEIAEIAAQPLADNHGVFQKIFLFNALYGNQQAVQLWPE